MGRLVQPHQLQMVIDHAIAHRLGMLLHHLVHRQGNVLAHRQPGQQGVILEHHHAIGPRLGDLATLQDDAAAAGLIEAGQDIQQGGLAAPRVPHQADKFPLMDG